jgi:four helix bundle protein
MEEEKKKYLSVKDLEAYRIAFDLSNYVWNIVIKWQFFARDTIGNQYVKAVDSISANIAEGFGRYSKKDKIKFYRISMGSALESKDWTEKAEIRKLLSKVEYDHIFGELTKLPKSINSLILFTNKSLSI